MLSQPLTLNQGEVRGRGLSVVAPPPVLSLEDDQTSCSAVPCSPGPPRNTSSSSSGTSSSSCTSSSSPSIPTFNLSAHPSASSSCTSSSHLVHGSLHHLPPPHGPPPHPPPLHAPPPFNTLLPPPSVSITSHSMTSSPPFVPSSLAPFHAPPQAHHHAPPDLHIPPLHAPPHFHSPPLHHAPSYAPPPHAPPPHAPPAPCCACSSLLPRLLSVHRMEVRRLLRGALASLGRRLDSLERKSRRSSRNSRKLKRRQRGAVPVPPAASSAIGSTPLAPMSSSSSSEGGDSPPPLECNWGRKEKSRRRRHLQEEEEQEEEQGRFVGQMAVCLPRGLQVEEPLTLHTLSQSKRRRKEVAAGSQSEKTSAVAMVKNGHKRSPVLLRSTSQHALHLLLSAQSGWTGSLSEASVLSSGQWCFADLTSPTHASSNHNVLRLKLNSSWSFSPAPMLHLSAMAVGKALDLVRDGVYLEPQRSLKDWTAPPSLSTDHCYMRLAPPSSVLCSRRQARQRTNHSTRIVHPLRRRLLPPCLANGLLAPLPGVEASAPFPTKKGERGKRVSQIRIRRASPRETQLTPMGLPKAKRLKKKEFSLEEIYTNKNYKSPSTNRSLETIFEEPREKDGSLLVIGHQKRRRILLFPDFTQPRKRKKLQGAGLAVALAPRKRMAARRHIHGSDDDGDLDVMLVERLSALEDFLLRQGLET